MDTQCGTQSKYRTEVGTSFSTLKLANPKASDSHSGAKLSLTQPDLLSSVTQVATEIPVEVSVRVTTRSKRIETFVLLHFRHNHI